MPIDLIGGLIAQGLEQLSFVGSRKYLVAHDFDQYNQMIADVQQKTHLKVFDTRPYVQGNFPVDSGGNLLYRDATHLSHLGSLFFADKYDFESEVAHLGKK